MSGNGPLPVSRGGGRVLVRKPHEPSQARGRRPNRCVSLSLHSGAICPLPVRGVRCHVNEIPGGGVTPWILGHGGGGTLNRLVLAGVGTAFAFSGVAVARLGGWAVVTVENPPDVLVAGKATEMTFTVRQHGMSLMSDLRPSIDAVNARG